MLKIVNKNVQAALLITKKFDYMYICFNDYKSKT